MSGPSKPEVITRGGSTIFCEDVRVESSGKLMLIGVYGDILYVPEFPYEISGLTLMVLVVTPLAQPFEEFALRVLADGEVLHELIVDKEGVQGARNAGSETPVPSKQPMVEKLRVMIRLPAIRAEKAMTIRIRGETESEILACGALEIQAAPARESDQA